MKAKLLWLLVPFALWGCQDEAAEGKATAASMTELPAYTEQYVPNPQVSDDRRLQERGQQTRDAKGSLELLAANMEPTVVQVGDIELTIHEAKLLHYAPDHSVIDFYRSYTHDAEFQLAKFFIEMRNTSSERVKFAPVALMETENGEVKTWKDEVYLEALNEGLAPGEVKSGNIGFIVGGETGELKLTTSNLLSENGHPLAQAATIRLLLR